MILAVEIVYAKPGMDAATLKRVARIDALYGATAAAVLAAGFARAIWGLKGWDYYAGNPLFWAKVGAFVLVGLLSIGPTVRIIKWNLRLKAEPDFRPTPEEVKATRVWMHAETTVLILIPVIAAALARGLAD